MLGFFKRRAPAQQRVVQYDANRSLDDISYVFIDTELTGFNERTDSIISIGAVKMVAGRIEIGNTFYSLVKPKSKSKMNGKSILIHTITPTEVSGEKDIPAVLSEFLEFCGQEVLIGHYVSIDLGFINKVMKQTLGFPLANPILDTFTLYSWLWERWSSESQFSLHPQRVDLYEIAKSFGIPFTGAHNAVMDAFITAQVFQHFLPWLKKSGINNLENLLKVGNPFKGGEHRIGFPAQINNL
jgi:DNA polymerase III subunit epsilon